MSGAPEKAPEEKPKDIPKENKKALQYQIYNMIFDEQFKTVMLVLRQLHKLEACTWSEIFEGSGLKQMGVSTNTVSRVLRELQWAGIVGKEKAPFPFKTRYRLIVKDNRILYFLKIYDEIAHTTDPLNYEKLIGYFRWLANLTLTSLVNGFAHGNWVEMALLTFFFIDLMHQLAVNTPSELRLKLTTEMTEKYVKFFLKKDTRYSYLLKRMYLKSRKRGTYIDYS